MQKGKTHGKRTKAATGEDVKAAHVELTRAVHARRSGNIAQAITICEKLVTRYPDFVAALHELGLAQMARNDYWSALSCFVRATMLNPSDWTLLASLAQCHVELGALEQAAIVLERARALEDENADIQFTLGKIYEREREYEDAVQAFETALRIDDSHALAANSLGDCLVHLGQLEQAAQAYQRAHEANPKLVAPVISSAQLPLGLAPFDVLKALESTRLDRSFSEEERILRTAFARAHVHDKASDHAAAWEKLVEANAILAKRYARERKDRPRYHAETNRIADQHLQSIEPPAMEPDLPISLFVLGISRSGKTTCERILGQLPGVKRGYENPIVELCVKRASQAAALPTIENLLNLPMQLGEGFATQYRNELVRRANGASVFTNTHPGRIADVGLLAKLVPNMRFIFVKRDRDDTALRIFMKHFREYTNVYAYDLSEIFAEIEWYHGMIDKWQERLPAICRTVEYEQMVENPAIIADLANELCGLSDAGTGRPAVGDDRGCAQPYLEYMRLIRKSV